MQTEPRHLLFVLGMHRSGTSALCAALRACGASFGDHLLAPMRDVNDEGFWEDAEVVAVNESLLRRAGGEWYACGPDVLDLDWRAGAFDEERRRARAVLQRGFGEGPLEAVKDPRLCLTLPFWLDLCAGEGIAAYTCVINRAPLEVARSLEKRDGFPVGYGLRLQLLYRRAIARHAPADAVYLTYPELLSAPAECLRRLPPDLPLEISDERLSAVVRTDLRHHGAREEEGLLAEADAGAVDLDALEAAIERFSPPQRMLGDLVGRLVERGERLTEIGTAHTRALETLDQRDADVEKLGAELRYTEETVQQRDRELADVAGHLSSALATIDERDEQIREFDRRLSQLGEEHSYALDLIRARDAQLQRCFDKPGIGLLFRAMWKHEQR